MAYILHRKHFFKKIIGGNTRVKKNSKRPKTMTYTTLNNESTRNPASSHNYSKLYFVIEVLVITTYTSYIPCKHFSHNGENIKKKIKYIKV